MNDITPEPTAADLDELALAIGKAATEIVSNIKTPNEIARLAIFDELLLIAQDLYIGPGVDRAYVREILKTARALQK